MEKYERIGEIHACKVMDKNGKLKKIIYPKDMNLEYNDTLRYNFTQKRNRMHAKVCGLKDKKKNAPVVDKATGAQEATQPA